MEFSVVSGFSHSRVAVANPTTNPKGSGPVWGLYGGERMACTLEKGDSYRLGIWSESLVDGAFSSGIASDLLGSDPGHSPAGQPCGMTAVSSGNQNH